MISVDEEQRVASLDQDGLRAALTADRFEWSVHALSRMARRGIRQKDVIQTLDKGRRIEDYPEDTPYPSALFLGMADDGGPIHVVAAYDAAGAWGYIITAYVPDAGLFEEDWATRRTTT